MASKTTKKAAPTRMAPKSTRPAGLSVNRLAEQLASGLTIADAKGKKKAPALTEEETRLESMRAVNAASQALSAAMQSGWKKSSGKQSSESASAAASSAAAAKHLALLRQASSGSLDVERAAMSVLGKLVALEMHDEAMSALEALHPALCSLHHVTPPMSRSSSRFHLLSIPLPSSDIPADLTLLTLTMSYLTYALTVVTRFCFTPIRNSKEPTSELEAFSQALRRSEPTLLTWMSRCSTLPAKQLDSILTRAYTALTKACATCKSNHQAVFSLRMYAVMCLASTSTGTVESTTFWDQVVRFGGVFVKSQSLPEEEAVQAVLSAFRDLVELLEKRNDNGFLTGKSFVQFCEYWMVFAKKSGDICLVDRIAGLIQGISMASSSSSKQDVASDKPTSQSEGSSEEVQRRSKTKNDRDTLEAARLCATLAQTTAVLEQKSPDMVERIKEVILTLKESKDLLRFLQCPQEDDPEYVRISGKVDRALERMRRATISVLDSSTRPLHDADYPLQTLLQETANILQRQCSSALANADIFTRTLDTLFVLARTQLLPSDPRTYVPAYDTLTKATQLVEPRVADPTIDAPNYLRCISGAFHNIAGTLYQAGRHGSAVGFLKDACALGARALELRRSTGTTSAVQRGDRDARTEEGWKQLDEQLYRRWELLGVCYSKIGDRKQALQAFLRCVKTFPYCAAGFAARTAETTLPALFELSSGTKQLGTIVDRVTHLSGCELLLHPTAVSLVSLQISDPGVTGALLERQIDSLESSRWKEGVPAITAQLLKDALQVYRMDMPVRRARVLVKCMDFTYHAGPGVMVGMDSPEIMGGEVEKLLLGEDCGQDMGLAGFCVQYRAAARLWRALHAHRRMDAKQSTLMGYHSEEACKLLKTVLGATAEQKSARKSSPKQIVAPKKTALGPPARTRSTRKTVVAREPVTPKPKTRKALQPVSLNVQTPPRQSETAKSLVTFDDFEKLLALLQLTARICGFLALILPKVHILDVSRKLCDLQLGIQSDGYIINSVELAYEYIKLGKTRRAVTIFNQALNAVRSGKASDEASSFFFLRFAESLAMAEDVPRSSTVYCEALSRSENFELEDKRLPTAQRIQGRAKRLEMAAIASHVFALIQYSKEDVTMALDGMLRSLRLWNRATDTLSRLHPSPSNSPPPPAEDNPFQMSSLKDALPTEPSGGPQKELPPPKKTFPRRTSMDGLEWRISEGLLTTLFSLHQLYFNRGSAREAEYFAQQAQDLAESLNAPPMVSRALAKKAEIQLYQAHFDASRECLTKASELLENIPGTENVDVRRLQGVYNERLACTEDANEFYEASMSMIDELDQAFKQFDGVAFGRKSIGSSPPSKPANEVVLSELLAAVLRQRIWLLRDSDVEDYTAFLDKFLSLPRSFRTKAEENALMAKLTLHAVYTRFRGDMFLSSLAESTIALPMGMSSKAEITSVPPPQDILATLDAAEKLFLANLASMARRGNIADVREAVVSLALIQAFQTSLGNRGDEASCLTASLLDASAAITLRREMLDCIDHKFSSAVVDDIKWPHIGPDGSSQPRPLATRNSRFSLNTPLNSDDEESEGDESSLREYWESVRMRYQAQTLDPPSLSSTRTSELPSNWTIVHINVTEDKSTLFITRQECGGGGRTPLIFYVPLKGRRDNGSEADDEVHLTFEDAITELKEIVRLSDEGTKRAARIKADDQEARAVWWKERSDLDTRLRELLENVEFCWLGAFKTILSPRPNLTTELISDLRTQFEKVFHRGLHVQDKKTKHRSGSHKKTASQSQSQAASQVTFDDSLLECFSTLSPKCRDEELEDLVYFVLDLYQFHGVPVAIAEVDIIQVVLDLRAVLEDHVQKLSRRKIPAATDEHLFLVLDKNLQGLPWESIPILRGRSVSRIPSVDFLHDRILFAKWKRRTLGINDTTPVKGAIVDPRKGYYMLNPSGDLEKTEGRFRDWVRDMERAGWDGVIGHPPSEQQFLNALRDQDLVVYFGHGGGEQYLRSHKIRNLPTCAATMLWGCSSGALREMGDFDRVGTPYNYMLAGCPCLVANLWDVTDRDIDKFSQSVFDRLGLTSTGVKQWGRRDGQVSVVAAIGQSRDTCKLKYLTGAAPVVYGIPFYL
ncbi:putative peptidase family C50 [Lyophyllum shimeji]|uniref:separase n=1 Tax=Lyophyllum shimeji TaxID=47721 RepID=A0A9P3PUW6_LYOSH|nr:putative peptidase family C50 [Lyophyllum shimeji]